MHFFFFFSNKRYLHVRCAAVGKNELKPIWIHLNKHANLSKNDNSLLMYCLEAQDTVFCICDNDFRINFRYGKPRNRPCCTMPSRWIFSSTPATHEGYLNYCTGSARTELSFLRMLFISIKNVKTWHELSVNSDRYSGYVRVDSENGVTRYDIPIQILENDNEYNSIINSLSKTYMNYSCRWDQHNAFTIHINRKTNAFR